MNLNTLFLQIINETETELICITNNHIFLKDVSNIYTFKITDNYFKKLEQLIIAIERNVIKVEEVIIKNVSRETFTTTSKNN